MIRVLLADDQALVRAGFGALLNGEPDIEVVGEAGDGRQALTLVRQLVPDVVLMDIRMPDLDGLAATRAIADDPRLGAVKIIVLTTFDLDEYIFEAVRHGASGFLVKDTEPVELLRAVRVVAVGDALLSPTVTRRLIAEFASRAQPPPARRLEVLTKRESAERLYLSPATVKTHINRAMSKLGARDRAQLVVFAYESGLVRPGWTA
jgi:DNA-binding NarL/FixJ family response regulator